MANKAVILGCNYYIGLSVIRCLGTQGIHTVAVDYDDKNAYAMKSKYCSERLIVPHYKEQTELFIRYLIDFAQKQDEKPILFPCHDSYVEVVDAHLEELRAHYLIPSIAQGLYTTALNKESLHRLAEKHGILVPETLRLDEPNLIEEAEKQLGFPCVVKPTDSPAFMAKFRRKLFKVHDREELEEALDKAEKAGLEVIVQRIIPGFDDHMYTYDAFLNEQSKITHYMTCQKYRQFPINFGASVYTGQTVVEELHTIGGPFLEAIGWKGFAEIEFKKDAETGHFYLIEINVRTTNLNHLLYKVGLNFPYIAYCELTGKPLPPDSIREETNRVFWYFYEDMLAIRDYVRTKQLTVGQVLRSLTKPKVHSIWDWRDPRPAFAFASMIGGKILRKFKQF